MTEPRGPIGWARYHAAQREIESANLYAAMGWNDPQQSAEPVILDEQPASITLCRCGNYPGNHPFPGCPTDEQPVRHSVDTITDNDLDQLYADAERADEVIGELNEANIALARRAGRVEAVLADVRGHLRYLLNYDGPGHCHLVPGRWDKDGSPCDHCARLAAARLALDTPERTR
ncbi:hypothetical protein [Streptomyces sp. NPDC059949]|uniref:hypothetical protein n=1 Tax=Streptomyces sp. NPDC059949 TaxID=3347013 RepID=UPI00365F5908